MNRRNLIRAALALPAAGCEILAAPQRKQVKITAIKALQLRGHLNSVIRIETDAGLAGYGEAGLNGPMARTWAGIFQKHLAGQDPLAIERHFEKIAAQVHPYQASIPAVSGVDMALWDLAGKITGLPVCSLLGGSFRDRIRLYVNSAARDMLDRSASRDWGQRLKQERWGWNAVKINVMHPLGRPGGPWEPVPMLRSDDFRKVQRAFANAREALGDDIDIMAHCHNELDLPSAIQVARAVEPVGPYFLEDPLQVAYSDSWKTLHSSARMPLLTGEKLELPQQFLPFLQNQAIDMLHIDLAFVGGITGARRVADLARIYRLPIVCHNIGTLVLMMASAHFGAAVHNFIASENVLGQGYYVEKMAAGDPPAVEAGYLRVPVAPGLGADLDPDVVRADLAPGEPWWN